MEKKEQDKGGDIKGDNALVENIKDKSEKDHLIVKN